MLNFAEFADLAGKLKFPRYYASKFVTKSAKYLVFLRSVGRVPQISFGKRNQCSRGSSDAFVNLERLEILKEGKACMPTLRMA